MAVYHHSGDIVSTDFSPVQAFFFTRLRIGEEAQAAGLVDEIIEPPALPEVQSVAAAGEVVPSIGETPKRQNRPAKSL
jgi:hypothetical protein